MKKNAKKLTLHRETIQNLTSEEKLKEIVGGTLPVTGTNCNISFCICD